MSVVFDIGAIAIIALCTFIGYKQGLVKSAIKILSFFIAIIVAFSIYKPVSKLIINNTSIDDNIKNVMIEKIKPEGMEKEQEVDVGDNVALKIMGEATNTIEEIAETFTTKLIETVTLLVIFLIVKIALRFVTVLTDLITKLPLLKQVNKLGGTIYGIVKGIILVYVILAVVYLITPLLQKNIVEDINKSIITKTLYNNNLILNTII